jgi:hypothetical protein
MEWIVNPGQTTLQTYSNRPFSIFSTPTYNLPKQPTSSHQLVIVLLFLVWHITINTRTNSTTKLATLCETYTVLSRNSTERDWQSLLKVILYNTFAPKPWNPFQIINHLVQLSNQGLPMCDSIPTSDVTNVEDWDTICSTVNALLVQFANDNNWTLQDLLLGILLPPLQTNCLRTQA